MLTKNYSEYYYMSVKTVFCSRFKKELPALEKAPFAGELGQEILSKVSSPAWAEWKEDMMIKIINEYRLNMNLDEDYQKLIQQMKGFLGLNAEQVLEVENESRGKNS